MRSFQKLVFLIIAACSSSVLALLPSASSSSHEGKPVTNHKRNSGNNQKLSSELSSEITIHGFLLWASIGFFMPVSVLIIRMSNKVECGRRHKLIFYFHAIFQILSVLLATAGAVLSIKNFDNSFSTNHQRIGSALYAIIWLLLLMGLFRPQRGTKGRSIWYGAHWALGTGVSALGIINIYTGLQAYQKKTLRSTRLWTLLFTAEIVFIGFVYLLQDKRDYIQKQGMVSITDPTLPTNALISPTANHQKEINIS